jgi:hypothetical protein
MLCGLSFSIKNEDCFRHFRENHRQGKLCWQGPYDEILVIIGFKCFLKGKGE